MSVLYFPLYIVCHSQDLLVFLLPSIHTCPFFLQILTLLLLFLFGVFPFFFQRKCERYWPPKGMAERFRDIEVSLDGKEKYATYILRTFHLKYKPRRVSCNFWLYLRVRRIVASVFTVLTSSNLQSVLTWQSSMKGMSRA